jgi:hypothetical protein
MRSATVVLLISLSIASVHAKPPAPGAPNPALRLPTIDGRSTVDLRSLRGRKVLLIQFASW